MRSTASSLLVVTLWTVTACDQLAPVVRYTDELTNEYTGRTALVRVPAEAFGMVGFVSGIPLDLVALPASYVFYEMNKNLPPGQATDAVTIFLFPSFVLWRGAILLAAPLDAIEFLCYRVFLPAKTMNPFEQEDLENRIDRETLPRHPVEPLYPVPKSDGAADSGR